MDDLIPGTLVQIKGQETVMTIAELREGKAHCVWFDDNNKLQRSDFLIECLISCE